MALEESLWHRFCRPAVAFPSNTGRAILIAQTTVTDTTSQSHTEELPFRGGAESDTICKATYSTGSQKQGQHQNKLLSPPEPSSTTALTSVLKQQVDRQNLGAEPTFPETWEPKHNNRHNEKVGLQTKHVPEETEHSPWHQANKLWFLFRSDTAMTEWASTSDIVQAAITSETEKRKGVSVHLS